MDEVVSCNPVASLAVTPNGNEPGARFDAENCSLNGADLIETVRAARLFDKL